MKKCSLIIVIITIAFCICFTLVACGETQTSNDNYSSTNNYGGNTYTPNSGSSNITGSGGNTTNHTHTYSTAWTHDNDYHWHDATCGHDVVSSKTAHTWQVTYSLPATETTTGLTLYTCSVCGATKSETIPVIAGGKTEPTVKSDFAYKEYQSGYALTSYSGTDSVVTVPSTYNGKSVLAIGIYTDSDCIVLKMPSSYELTQNAGFYQNKSITKVVLPNTITVIGAMAFAGCSSLKEVNIPTSCKTVYSLAFQSTALKSITIPQNTAISTWWPVFNNVALESIRFDGPVNFSNVTLAKFFYSSESLTFDLDDYDLEEHFTLNHNVDMTYGGTISYSFNGDASRWFRKNGNSYYLSGTPNITTNSQNNRTYFEGRYITITETTPTKISGTFYTIPSSLKKVYVSVKATNVNAMADPSAPFSVEYYDGNTVSSRITYDYDGGTGNNASTYTFSEGYTLKAPTKMGYTFTGWTGSNGTTPQLYVTIPRNTQGDKSYKANWQLTTYTITYNLNGGTSSNPTAYTINTSAFTLANPTKTGYTFTGWTGSNGTTPHTSVRINPQNTTNLSYTANWQPITYTITYNLNGGTNSNSNPTKYTVESNTITLANATRTGYTFGGWHTNSACTQSTTGIAAGSHGNMTVYAKWTIIAYTITYNLNGGTNSSSNPTKYTVETIGDGVALAPASKETVSNSTGYEYLGNGNYSVTYDVTAYTFLGWYTESTFVNQVPTITPADGNVTLYAKWSETTSTTTETVSAYTRDGNYIYFGTYPQTQVTDSTIKTALNTAAGTLPTSSNAQAWTSYGYYINSSVSDYMWYIDLTYNGEKYRGVYFTSYRPVYTKSYSSAGNSYQGNNGYNSGNVYWFKFEPIKWRILSEYNGNALILCERIIDSQEYYPSNSTSSFSHNGSTGYANNYALSNIRKWLNDSFYNTAFNDLQKELILLTTVDNSARSTNPDSNATLWNNGVNGYACANTQDYVFLLSEQEVTTTTYGFSSSYSDYDTARRKQNTDYAKCQGAWTSTDSSYYGNGFWWLRSPYYNRCFNARCVNYYGFAVSDDYVYDTSVGVVPALEIRLS